MYRVRRFIVLSSEMVRGQRDLLDLLVHVSLTCSLTLASALLQRQYWQQGIPRKASSVIRQLEVGNRDESQSRHALLKPVLSLLGQPSLTKHAR